MKHMKKVAALLLAALMVALFCTPMAARKEEGGVLIHDAETRFGSFMLDSTEQTEGKTSLSTRLSGDSFVAECKLRNEIDISDNDTVAIDLYISDVEKVAGISSMFFELSSAGKCDEDELQWEFVGQLRSDQLEDGWNTVYLDIGVASVLGTFDDMAVNYLRFYTFYSGAASGLTIKLDNIRACNTGGEDFSDMELDAYQGDNGDVDVIIQGQAAPDLSRRDEGITRPSGIKK
jgi:hypothetical protein